MALSTAMAISSLLHTNFLPQLLSSTSSLSSSSSLSTSISTTKTLRNTSFKIKSLRTEKEASSSDPNPGFDPKSGVAVYKPKSYEVLVTDAANSLAYALQDGKSRLEIDFPYVLFSFCYCKLVLSPRNSSLNNFNSSYFNFHKYYGNLAMISSLWSL
jgi:hypothetical protein